jgi:hypothetical protein
VPNGSCRTSFSEFGWHAPRLQLRPGIGHAHFAGCSAAGEYFECIDETISA